MVIHMIRQKYIIVLIIYSPIKTLTTMLLLGLESSKRSLVYEPPQLLPK